MSAEEPSVVKHDRPTQPPVLDQGEDIGTDPATGEPLPPRRDDRSSPDQTATDQGREMEPREHETA